MARVVLFDFGAQVDGYRSDMTRTLFVGEPAARDLDIYELVARAQAAAIETVRQSVAAHVPGAALPSGRRIDAVARDVIDGAGPWVAFRARDRPRDRARHARSPSLGRLAPDTPLPSPTVFSVEPGVYLEGEVGVRIEDLVHLDAAAGRVELLTRFPREVLVVGR